MDLRWSRCQPSSPRVAALEPVLASVFQHLAAQTTPASPSPFLFLSLPSVFSSFSFLSCSTLRLCQRLLFLRAPSLFWCPCGSTASVTRGTLIALGFLSTRLLLNSLPLRQSCCLP
ncbi:hypothetical protein POX_d05801 [Penicillium oxalicum]|uniref:Uncharacterized protein n=1 Tax=Penicillium oxalicum (strain 114-2 / CGMCC 5302) TaxID=933388 RepID=S7ZNS3_PENO1|nr:hypothetical protein POX_d05801 [Penicillium oxalicum]EPS32024.1 hypothetical protein PDE_06983 [Penicillium oxalicum 114-2]KAI2790292.1 hypothetical protein POX_d05801 [Penicillium oxalicum]